MQKIRQFSIDFSQALDMLQAESSSVIFSIHQFICSRKELCNVVLFKVMLSIKFLCLEQLASMPSFEFSLTEFSSSSLAWMNVPVLSLKYFGSNWVKLLLWGVNFHPLRCNRSVKHQDFSSGKTHWREPSHPSPSVSGFAGCLDGSALGWWLQTLWLQWLQLSTRL